MKGSIISFFGEPAVLLIVGVLIAILVAVIIFGVKTDTLLNFLSGWAPK